MGTPHGQLLLFGRFVLLRCGRNIRSFFGEGSGEDGRRSSTRCFFAYVFCLLVCPLRETLLREASRKQEKCDRSGVYFQAKIPERHNSHDLVHQGIR